MEEVWREKAQLWERAGARKFTSILARGVWGRLYDSRKDKWLPYSISTP